MTSFARVTVAALAGLSLIAPVVGRADSTGQQTPPPPPTTAPPVPRPFPTGKPADPAKPTTPPTSTSAPLKTASQPGAPSEALLGVALHPAAEFLEAFDAGRGQRYYLFGTDTPFLDMVTYYKTALKQGGRELFKQPAMYQFDLGRFQEETMAYPPSVVVKDYTWNGSPGYLFVSGTTEKRYKTIIQIVPAR